MGTGRGLRRGGIADGGGLKALQTASIAAALPVSVIMLFMTYGLVKSLHEDPSAVSLPDEKFAPDGTRLGADLRT